MALAAAATTHPSDMVLACDKYAPASGVLEGLKNRGK